MEPSFTMLAQLWMSIKHIIASVFNSYDSLLGDVAGPIVDMLRTAHPNGMRRWEWFQLLMPCGCAVFGIGRCCMVDRMNVIIDSTPKWHEKMGMAYLLMPSGFFGFGTEWKVINDSTPKWHKKMGMVCLLPSGCAGFGKWRWGMASRFEGAFVSTMSCWISRSQLQISYEIAVLYCDAAFRLHCDFL